MGLSFYIITPRDPFEKSVLLIPALGIVGLEALLSEDILRIPLHFSFSFQLVTLGSMCKEINRQERNHYPSKSN